MTHIWVSKITIIGTDNGLSPGRRQAIIWTSVWILLIGPLGTNFSEILIEIYAFSFKNRHLKMSSGKWRPFCLGLNVLIGITTAKQNTTKPCAYFMAHYVLVSQTTQLLPLTHSSLISWKLSGGMNLCKYSPTTQCGVVITASIFCNILEIDNQKIARDWVEMFFLCVLISYLTSVLLDALQFCMW